MDTPIRIYPNKCWQHFRLWNNVANILSDFDLYFQTINTNDLFDLDDDFFDLDDDLLMDLPLEDIFTLNVVFAGACERAVVKALNQLKHLWNIEGLYTDYKFYYQRSLFPDVLLCHKDKNPDKIIMGIELKGWYIFAKEKEPSFRYCVSPNCCAVADLVMVVPWCLDKIYKGKIIIKEPFIDLARYAAEYRNYHWTTRRTKDSTEIISPPTAICYPRKNIRISDQPKYDAGFNFGRFARSGIMDKYLKKIKSHILCGKSIQEWMKTLYNKKLLCVDR